MRGRRRSRGASGGLAQLASQPPDLLPEAGGRLEAQVLGGLVHLLLQGLHETTEVVGRQVVEIEDRGAGGRGLSTTPSSPAPSARRGAVALTATGPDHVEDVGDLLAHRLRVDPVLEVVLELLLAPPVGL